MVLKLCRCLPSYISAKLWWPEQVDPKLLLMASRDVCWKHHSRTSGMIRSYLGSLVFGEEVQGKNCFTNFHELDMTTYKLRSLAEKWQTLIEAADNVETIDECLRRLFCIGCTDKRRNSRKKKQQENHLCQTGAGEPICKKTVCIVTRDVSTGDLWGCSKKIPDLFGRDIEKNCQSFYLLHDIFISNELSRSQNLTLVSWGRWWSWWSSSHQYRLKWHQNRAWWCAPFERQTW